MSKKIEVDGVAYERVDNVSPGCDGCVARHDPDLCGELADCADNNSIWRPIIVTPPPASQGKAGGLKFDGGKASWSLLMRGCAKALRAVVGVLDFGAKKYSADSWQQVENARERYKDALYRHLHQIELRGFTARDPETGKLEWAHVACNALFLLTFALIDEGTEE